MPTSTRMLLAGLVAFSTIRCGGSGDDTSTSIRVINANAFGETLVTSKIDIYIDDGDTPWIASLTYAQPSAAIKVAPGKHTLKAVTAGGSVTTLLATNDITVNDGERHLVVLEANPSVDPDDAGSLAEMFVDLPVTFAKAEKGTARVRFGLTISDGLVDLGAQLFGSGLSFDVGRDGADAIFTGLSEPAEASVAAGVESEVLITASGQIDLGAYIVPALEDGKDYYALYMGSFLFIDAASQRYRLLFVPADGGEAIATRSETAVYVMNAVLDAPTNLQFKIDGGVVANNVEFSDDLAGPFFRRSGQMTVQVLPGVDIPVVDFAALTTEGDQLAIVAGSVIAGADDPALRVIKPAAGDFAGTLSYHYRVINAADVGDLDFVLEQNGGLEMPLASNLPFGGSTNPPGINASVSGDLTIRAAGTMTNLATKDGTAGGFPFANTYVIAIGSNDANTPQEKTLRLVSKNANFFLLNFGD